MTYTSLPDSAYVGHAALVVADMERALAFYRDLMGFRDAGRDGDTLVLSADGAAPHLVLTERRGATPKPKRATGLYHVAIRLPSRRDLARLFARMLSVRTPFAGFSDHAVSEALYLDDPDGNGLELYRDRPRVEWPTAGQMTTDPLDLDGLLREADSAPWEGLPSGTDIGHMHLSVADLGRSLAFYRDVIGLDLMLDMSRYGALFLSAGGYHHHLGLNTWAGPQPPPANSLGLAAWSLRIPGEAAWAGTVTRVENAGLAVERPADGRAVTRDPDGTALELVLDGTAS